jgi:hypothetical protein
MYVYISYVRRQIHNDRIDAPVQAQFPAKGLVLNHCYHRDCRPVASCANGSSTWNVCMRVFVCVYAYAEPSLSQGLPACCELREWQFHLERMYVCVCVCAYTC